MTGLVCLGVALLVFWGWGHLAQGSGGSSLARRYHDEAKTLMQNGNLPQALIAAEKATELDSGFVQAHVLLASLYFFNEETEKSIASYRRAIKLTPQDANIYISLGVVYSVNNRFAELVKLYDEALVKVPRSAELYFQSGNAYMQVNQVAQAILRFNEGLKVDPGHKNMVFALGMAQVQKKDWAKARQIQEQLQKLDATLADKLGQALANQISP